MYIDADDIEPWSDTDDDDGEDDNDGDAGSDGAGAGAGAGGASGAVSGEAWEALQLEPVFSKTIAYLARPQSLMEEGLFRVSGNKTTYMKMSTAFRKGQSPGTLQNKHMWNADVNQQRQ